MTQIIENLALGAAPLGRLVPNNPAAVAAPVDLQEVTSGAVPPPATRTASAAGSVAAPREQGTAADIVIPYTVGIGSELDDAPNAPTDRTQQAQPARTAPTNKASLANDAPDAPTVQTSQAQPARTAPVNRTQQAQPARSAPTAQTQQPQPARSAPTVQAQQAQPGRAAPVDRGNVANNKMQPPEA